MTMALPPVLTTATGQPRHVGFEIEFIGIDLEMAGHAVQDAFGGQVSLEHKYAGQVELPDGEQFTLELDASMLKKISANLLRKQEDNADLWWDQTREVVLSPFILRIAPFEVVSPPLPMTMETLAKMDHLVEALRARGARGTGASPLYAFGVHINAEIPSRDPLVLLRYLQSFILLYDWLASRMQMNATRRLSAVAKPYPEGYARHILDPGYRPDLAQLVDDYLDFNPTRERALDMLPILLLLDEQRVRARVDSPLVKPRPAFHFRMPNCRVDEPDWNISHEWQWWVEVEKLAARPQLLKRMAARYLGTGQIPLHLVSPKWRMETERWRQWM